jgi:ATP-dependent helicase/nuclease subunit A
MLGLLSRLNDEISLIKEEKGLFLISDASPFIQKIINNNDTPFIYEKAGSYFNHLLIDEFQDTSNMQYGNFKPLISNSLSNNHNCLLVGDVKQSIYRWRNSNWKIFERAVEQDFQHGNIVKDQLDTNWRSDFNIIDFNNYLFKTIAGNLEHIIENNTLNFTLPVKLYSDVFQKAPEKRKKDEGYVSVKLFSKNAKTENQNYYGESLVEQINLALDKGFPPGHMALLVRNKSEGSELAQYIIEANKNQQFSKPVGVISNESLFLSKSPAVQLLISAIEYVSDTNSALGASNLLANYLFIKNADNSTEIQFPEGTAETEWLNKYINTSFIENCQLLKQESLYLMVEKLAELLNVYSAKEELVYIHSFLDLVFDYASSELSDLMHFLKFWKEEGNKQTISAAETMGSLRILTIHKSKGLQFPVVFIPFADWSIVPKSNEIHWLKTTEAPYDAIPVAPVSFSAMLGKSIFSGTYSEEKYLSLIDNLNLLYVAFTRAEKALFVMAIEKSEKYSDIHQLLKNAMEKLSNDSSSELAYSKDMNAYIQGNLKPYNYKFDKYQEQNIPCVSPNLLLPEVRFSFKADEFLYEKALEENHITYGRILHSIMENVELESNLKSAVRKKIEEGLLTEEEGQSAYSLLSNAISQPTVKEWFNGSMGVYTEADIIQPNGESRRPDRVMIQGNKAIVVDYKFGMEEDIAKHKKQVREYMHLILETGVEFVDGYLWYITEGDIVPV